MVVYFFLREREWEKSNEKPKSHPREESGKPLGKKLKCINKVGISHAHNVVKVKYNIQLRLVGPKFGIMGGRGGICLKSQNSTRILWIFFGNDGSFTQCGEKSWRNHAQMLGRLEHKMSRVDRGACYRRFQGIMKRTTLMFGDIQLYCEL